MGLSSSFMEIFEMFLHDFILEQFVHYSCACSNDVCLTKKILGYI